MSRTTQRERLLHALADRKWHSLPALVSEMRGYRISARIYELRRQYEIVWMKEYRRGVCCVWYRLKRRKR
jgi:hypothetical protein